MNRCVNVVGLGYIGLPTALMLAAHGVPVVGTDINESVIESLNKGEVTFEEEGIKELFQTALKNGISFSTKNQKTDMYIISVATPYDKETHKVDPAYVISAVESVLDICEKGAIIVIESTISPGTIDQYIRPILANKGKKEGEDIHLAHAPERIIPGNMINELVVNSRTIGADSREIAERIRDVYSSFCKGEIVLTDIRTAEMSKVVENSFRDVNIAFANELARICRAGGMDVQEVIRIANHHPRVNILSPGPGVGGHCISVDPWFLVGDFPEQAKIIRMARDINDSMPEYVLERIYSIMNETGISDLSSVGFYGLTYKEDVDDTRESPTLQLFETMVHHLAPTPKSYDPMCTEQISPGQMMDFDEFLNSIEMMVIMVNHTHLKENWEKVIGKIVLDTRDCQFINQGNNRVFTL